MEALTPTLGAPGQLQFCGNCTRLVSHATSTPLNGALVSNQSSKAGNSESESTTAHILRGCTILEALSIVCNVSTDSGLICSRCHGGIHDMMKAFLMFVQFANKNSTELFRALKARTLPFIQKVLEGRQTLMRREQDDPVVPEPLEIQLKSKVAANAARRRKQKYSLQRLQNILSYRRTRISVEEPDSFVDPEDDLVSPDPEDPELLPQKTRSILAKSKEPKKAECDVDFTDNSSTDTISPEPSTKEGNTEDEYNQPSPPVQIKVEWNIDEENYATVEGRNSNDLNGSEADDSLETQKDFSSESESESETQQRAKSNSDELSDNSEEDYKPVKWKRQLLPPPAPPAPEKKLRRILVRHPIPEPELRPKRPTTKRYTCLQPECGKQFALTSKFAGHLVTVHGMVKPFICRLCDSVFIQKPHLMEHLKSHIGESGSFDCQVPGCGAVFTKSVNLKSHMKVVHCENKFQCDQCEKAFSQQCVLKKHILLMHSKNEIQKPFVCNVCERRFVFAEYLKNHQKSHKTDRPYTCNTCNKTFKNTKGLKSHQVAHREDKPFVCQTCGRNFKTLGTLRTHGLAHINQRNFRCSLPACLRSFNRKVHLIQHFMAVHKLEKSAAAELAKKSNILEDEQEDVEEPGLSASTVPASTGENCTTVIPQVVSHRQISSGEINAAIQNIPDLALAGFNTNYFTQWNHLDEVGLRLQAEGDSDLRIYHQVCGIQHAWHTIWSPCWKEDVVDRRLKLLPVYVMVLFPLTPMSQGVSNLMLLPLFFRTLRRESPYRTVQNMSIQKSLGSRATKT